MLLFFVKQNTAYELRISDWRSDVCSSDLSAQFGADDAERQRWRFGLSGGLARCARLGGCCGARNGRSGLARLDLLDLRAQRLKVVGSGIAAQRFLNLGSACFQDLAGVFEVCRRCDGRTLLDGLDRLDQARRPGFQALQAGIEPFLVGLVVHGLVAQGYEDAEADQPEPQKALHHHGGGRAPGRLWGAHGWPPETEGSSGNVGTASVAGGADAGAMTALSAGRPKPF